MKVVLVFLLAGLVGSSFEKSPLLHRVFNGTEFHVEDYPFLALLEMQNGYTCTGTLISHNYVLTAAHCRVHGSDTKVTVHLGKDRIDQIFGLEIPSEEFITYDPEGKIDGYDKFGVYHNYDIALIKLSQSVKFTEEIEAAVLPSLIDLFEDLSSKSSTLLGWGISENVESKRPLMGDNYIESYYRCTQSFKFYFGGKYDPENTVCTSGEYSGVCAGDSGGPLIVDDKVVAVAMSISLWDGITYGKKDKKQCIGEDFNMFTKISSFLPWIANNTDIEIGLYDNTYKKLDSD